MCMYMVCDGNGLGVVCYGHGLGMVRGSRTTMSIPDEISNHVLSLFLTFTYPMNTNISMVPPLAQFPKPYVSIDQIQHIIFNVAKFPMLDGKLSLKYKTWIMQDFYQ